MPSCHDPIRPATPRTALISLLILVSCCVFTGCEGQREASSIEPANADTYFPIRIGEQSLQLQLALTPAEHQKGLMFREELPDDHGMLFLFERPEQRGFWMKNTSLPLDIGYFDAGGELQEVHKLFPFDETPVTSRSRQILIAVETNRGWYGENGIRPGALLDLDALKSAITARGFSTNAYALEN
ncbi:MAG TPA: DUF192 domain-containing protein [Opitutales bacterium]|nr:DUF192 domain-containing protein [Opitutales bacterium]